MSDEFDPEVQSSLAEQEDVKRKQDEGLVRQTLQERHRAYFHMFVTGEVTEFDRRIVLQDLRKFCRMGISAFHEDARIHALLSGRQEVMLRIDDYTKLDADALYEKYTKLPER